MVAPLDMEIANLSIFNTQTAEFKAHTQLSSALFDKIKFIGLNDRTIRPILAQYAKQAGYTHDSGELALSEARMNEIAAMVPATLEEQVHLQNAYEVAEWTARATQVTGLIITGAAARNMMRNLDSEKLDYNGLKISSIEYVQIFDFALKGALMTAYQVARVLPEPDKGAVQLQGVDQWRNLGKELYEAGSAALREPYQNKYNGNMWKGYLLFDGVLNLPGFLLSSGRPITELKEIGSHVEHFGREAINHAYDLAENTIAPLMKYLPGKDKAEELASAAGKSVNESLDLLGGSEQERAAVTDTNTMVRDPGNTVGAQWKKRQQAYGEIIKGTMQKDKKAVLLGGIYDFVIGGVQVMGGPYRQLAQRDIVYAALDEIYKKSGGF